jgi:hypothetical protein
MQTSDDSDIAARLEDAGRQLRAQASAHVPLEPPRAHRVSRTSRRPVLIALAGVAVIAGVTTYVATRSDQNRRVILVEPSTRASETTNPSPADTAGIPDGAEPLPPAPLSGRSEQSVVWTGNELIAWGGRRKEPDQTLLRDGAAYSPTTHAWSPIASAPVSGGHAAVWSEGRMMVFGVDNSRRAAAYDPADNQWASIANLPIDLQIDGLSAVDWKGAPVLWNAGSRDVWTYNALADAWSSLGASPDIGAAALRGRQSFCACVDDQRLLSSGSYLFAVGKAAVAYRSMSDTTWRIAPPDPEPRASEGMASSTAGGLLVRWRPGPEMGDGSTSVFDPRTGRWATVAAPPLQGCEGGQHSLELHSGKLIAFDSCGLSALFDPHTTKWSQLSLAQTSGDYAVATDTGIVSWGETCCFGDGTDQLSVRGWMWSLPGE